MMDGLVLAGLWGFLHRTGVSLQMGIDLSWLAWGILHYNRIFCADGKRLELVGLGNSMSQLDFLCRWEEICLARIKFSYKKTFFVRLIGDF